MSVQLYHHIDLWAAFWPLAAIAVVLVVAKLTLMLSAYIFARMAHQDKTHDEDFMRSIANMSGTGGMVLGRHRDNADHRESD